MHDPQLLLFFGVIVVSVIAFAREWFPIEITALLVLATLLLTGLVDMDEAVAGFSNHAVITIGAMFILSHAFAKTGFITAFTVWLEENGRGLPWLVMLLFLVAVALFSAFINNTATVAILIPVAGQLAQRLNVSPSKVMMPLSFVAIVGGTCTIIGTSTNLIVNEIAVDAGVKIGIFELSRLGLILVVVTLLYIFAAQRWLIPSRLPIKGLTKKYHLGTYLTEIRISGKSPLIGQTFIQADLKALYEVTVLEILRGGDHITTNIRNQTLQAEDQLIIQCPVGSLLRLRDEQGILLLSDIKMDDRELSDNENVLIEAMVSPNSRLAGATLKDMDFRKRYGVFVLAVKRYREIMRQKIAYITLKTFDTLLIFGSRTRIAALTSDPNFIVLEELSHTLHKIKYWRVAVAIIPLVVLLATIGVLDIMEAALLGAILIMALGIVPAQEAYKSINWSVIFLIAAFIPLGSAMETVHLSDYIETFFFGMRDQLGDRGLITIFFFLTMIMTSFLSHSATAIIMTPLAIHAAELSGVALEPYIMTVMFAASLSFMTPNGYQTNTMIFNPGGYRYTDFLLVGVPLHIILGITGVILIPVFWPF